MQSGISVYVYRQYGRYVCNYVCNYVQTVRQIIYLPAGCISHTAKYRS